MSELPKSVAEGVCQIGPLKLKFHVLDDGQRVIETESAEAFFAYLASGADWTEKDAIRLARMLAGDVK